MFLSTLRRNIAWNVLCVLIVLAGFLGSSASGALKTANWIGGGVAGSYNDPANWDIPVVPINGADDYIVNIAAGVTVNFDVPATGHQIFQFTLPSTSTFVVDSGRDIEVTDAAAISGIVNTTNGQLLAGHASSSFGGSTSRVTVAGGGDITAGGASYSCAGLNGFYTIFSADSISSTLNFPQLTSIDAARSSGTDLVYTVKASNDGAIDMPALTSISGPTYEAHDRIEFIVESGGTINMNNLATTTSGNGKVRFDIRDAPGGVFSLPALQTSNDAEFILATGLTANLGTAGTPAAQNGGSFTLGDGAIVNYTPLTTLQWATINLGINSEFHAPDLLDIGGSIVTLAPGRTLETGVIGWLDNARIAVTGGSQWGVAQGDLSATSYACTDLNGVYTIFSASDGSSVLDLSTLTSIDASLYSGTNLVYTVRASNSGAIDLSGVTNVSGPTYEAHDRIEFIVESGGTIDLSNLATTTSGNGKVRFDIRDAPVGGFALPALQTSDDAEFIVAAGLTVNLGTAGIQATQSGGSFTLGDSAIVNYTPLTTLEWSTISLGAGSEFHAPNLVDIDGTTVALSPGRTLDTGLIGSLDNARIAVTGGSQWGVAQGNISATSYACTDLNGVYTIFSASDGGSALDLSTLTSIDASLYSGTNLVYTVRASNSGAIDLSALTNVSGPTYEAHDRIEFIVESGGTIDLSNLATTTSGNGKVRFDVRDTSGGAFSLPALQTSDDAEFIVAAGLTVNLGAAGNPATQSGGSFTLGAGAEVYYTPLTTLEWSTINLGGGSLFHAPNLVDIDGTSWTLSPGGVLSTGEISSLDNARLTVTGGTQWGVAQGNLSATSYSCADLIGQYTIFSATDTGSALDLSTLTSIDASLYSGTDLVYTVRASNNGAIDLSVLASVSGPTYEAHDRIEFIVESGGTIDLSSLMTTTSGVGKVRFDIRDTSGGPFSLPALQTSDDMEVIVAAGGLTVNLGTAGTPATQSGGSFTLGDSAVVNYTPLTTLEWSTISLGVGSEFHAPNLVDIDGTTVTLSPGRTFETGVIGSLDNARLAVTGGVEWGVAQGNLSATSYSCAGLDGQYTILSATDAGSVLDLSTLTAIAADRWTGTNLVYSVRASDNGTVDLSGVTSVSVPTYETIDRIEFIATTGGTIDLSSLQTVTGGVGEARFTASAGGTMRFGELLLTDALNLSVADGASKVVVGGGLHLDPTSDLSITGGATVQIAGDFSYDYTSDSKLNADTGILQFHTAGDHQLEVGGLDLGVGGSTSGNLGLGRLVVGDNGAGARVTLVNLYDNLNPGGIEALYLYGSGGMDGLEIKDNSLLILGNVPAYAWIDGEMVDLHSLFGPGDVILPFQDAGGFNGGWISVVGRLPGDTDGDWDVDTDDYDTLVATFGGGPDLRTDFNEDGAVDLLDFAIQRDNFGFSLSGAPEAMAPTTTPEPATLAFLTLGGLAILRRKRSR